MMTIDMCYWMLRGKGRRVRIQDPDCKLQGEDQKSQSSSQRTGLPTTTPGVSTVLKLYPGLPDCFRLPKSDSTPGDTSHPATLNAVIMDVTPEGKPDAEGEKQQDAGEQSVEDRRWYFSFRQPCLVHLMSLYFLTATSLGQLVSVLPIVLSVLLEYWL